MNETIVELISRRRRQILVHSYIYYEANTNIIDDATYDSWSAELAELQREHPTESAAAVYYDAFRGYDGSSGFDLPYRSPEIVNTAERLLTQKRKRGTK